MNSFFMRIASLALFAQLILVIYGKQVPHRSNVSGYKGDKVKAASPKASCSGDECLCKDRFDLVIAAEASSFSGNDVWMTTYKPFLVSLVSKFQVAEDKVHMGLVLFASRVEEFVKFSDPESTDEEKLWEKIDSITEDDIGKTHNVLYVDAAFHALERMLYGKGARSDVPKATILFTYGYDNDTNKEMVTDVLEAYKEEGAKLIVIGMDIGENENMYALGGCANNDANCPTVSVIKPEYLFSAAREAKNKLCRSSKQ